MCPTRVSYCCSFYDYVYYPGIITLTSGLFFATIVISVIYQYFGRYWGNDDDEEGNFESSSPSDEEIVLHIHSNTTRNNSSTDAAFISNEYTYYNTMNGRSV